ncbi:hypothetical protein [Caballeronia sp. HLA56]
MKKILLTAMVWFAMTHAQAGTDVLLHFANLSQYTATVTFTPSDSTCWYDTVTDKRIDNYVDFYTRVSVSDTSFVEPLLRFKSAFGALSLGAASIVDMSSAPLALASASTGRVNSVFVRGETSAALTLTSNNCKGKTSSRGFNILLKNDSGRVVSAQRYVLSDPPDGAWTLSRTNPDNPANILGVITLGSAGEYSLSNDLTDLKQILPFSDGGANRYLKRVLTRETVSELSQDAPDRLALYYVFVGESKQRHLTLDQFVAFRINQEKDSTQSSDLLYGVLAKGELHLKAIRKDTNGHQAVVAVPDPAAAYAQMGLSDTTSRLTRVDGPEVRASICAHFEGTLGLSECRVAGVSLSIMPGGALVASPLPTVGFGNN